jgi:ABC-type nitrate/sulfonate/bicarbonate transport system substrate-binding protein
MDRNADPSERFLVAFRQANDFINNHEVETREIIGRFTRMQKKDLAFIGLPAFEPTLAPADLQAVADLAVKFKLLKQRPDLDAMICLPPNH